MTKHTADWYAAPPARWPQPVLKGHTIPGYRYTSKAFADQEWEKMWTKTWLLLGREDEIPEPGDYQMEEIGPESIIMARQHDGSIKAFYNVCQHRGARLVFNEAGSVDAFTCPYHGWRWEIDGRLTYAQDAEDFPEGDPCKNLVLEEVRCETFAGFIFVNMDPDCVGLKDYLGPVWDDWAPYEIHTWKRYLALTARLPVNWKVVLDNFNESYHLPTVHPQAESSVEENYRWTQFDMSEEGHNRMWMRAGAPSHILETKGGVTILDGLAQQLRQWDLDPADFAGREYETREALQRQMRKLGPERGYAYFDNLRDHQLTDVYHYFLFPNFAVSVWADGFHFLRARPHATDPEQCVFDNWWYAPAPEGVTTPVMTAGGIVERDAEVEHEVFDFGEKSLGVPIDQDMAVTPGQQKGFRSRGYTGVYLPRQEHRIRRYHEVLDEYIEGKRPAPRLAHQVAAE
ncbi:MAG: Rieske 2Fe-2S domain-containing protein [Alphaproteobacteria bacterium]|nr:Rieske 2Fe-2S domain-containing protein [Alphaproteobacteria bacterium]